MAWIVAYLSPLLLGAAAPQGGHLLPQYCRTPTDTVGHGAGGKAEKGLLSLGDSHQFNCKAEALKGKAKLRTCLSLLRAMARARTYLSLSLCFMDANMS